MWRTFKQQSEVVLTANLHAPIRKATFSIVDTVLWIVALLSEQNTKFGHYILAGHEFHLRETHHPVCVGDNVAQLDK